MSKDWLHPNVPPAFLPPMPIPPERKVIMNRDSTERNNTFDEFAAINLQRATRWHKGGLEEWSVNDWAAALGGEAGEVLNACKKLKRLDDHLQQHGIVPSSRDEAIQKIGREIGDVFTYLDLLAQRLGLSTFDCVRLAFNGISEREGFPERI